MWSATARGTTRARSASCPCTGRARSGTGLPRARHSTAQTSAQRAHKTSTAEHPGLAWLPLSCLFVSPPKCRYKCEFGVTFLTSLLSTLYNGFLNSLIVSTRATQPVVLRRTTHWESARFGVRHHGTPVWGGDSPSCTPLVGERCTPMVCEHCKHPRLARASTACKS